MRIVDYAHTPSRELLLVHGYPHDAYMEELWAILCTLCMLWLFYDVTLHFFRNNGFARSMLNRQQSDWVRTLVYFYANAVILFRATQKVV